MQKRKGFTLIELLAVIVILAIIAVIATPIIVGIIEDSKKAAFKDSAYGIIDAGELYYSTQLLKANEFNEDVIFEFPDASGLEWQGSKPERGFIKITKEGYIEIAITDGKYCVTKGIEDSDVTINDDADNCGLEQLETPTITLSETTITIVDNSSKATSYSIFANGEKITEITSTTLDLSTLNLAAGTYNITVKALAEGYIDSLESIAVVLITSDDSVECCFVAGTQVLMADGSKKNIEDINAGDQVLTYNEETRKYESGTVTTKIIKTHTVDMARLNFSDGSSIEMNAYHPIYTEEGWKSLTQHEGLPLLEEGDMALSTYNNMVEISSIDRWTAETPIVTYNLSIDGNHNYFVGDIPVLAHNASSCHGVLSPI